MLAVPRLQRNAVLLALLLAAVPAWAQKPPPIGAPDGSRTRPAAPVAPDDDEAPPRTEAVLPGKPPPLGAPDRATPPRPDRTPGPQPSDRADRLPGANERPTSSGTGFVVADGKLMTNHHVIEGCNRLVVQNAAKQRVPARVTASDDRLDLALLTAAPSVGPPLVFRESPAVRRGETVITYGFPLTGMLSSTPKLTSGDVSDLAGLRDNQNNLQISAAVQPGNSGGPLFDSQANVIGIVVSKLNALRTAEMTGGDIPQNVNFAVKGTEGLAFLRANGVTPRTAASNGPDKRNADIGDIANPSTVQILCFR